MRRPTFGTGVTRTPLGDRVPLDHSGLIQHATLYGVRFYRAGRTSIYAIPPSSRREPSRDSWEVSSQEAGRFVFEEFVWTVNGRPEPVLQPYYSASVPERIGFEYGPGGRAYRAVARGLYAGATGHLPGRRRRSR